MTTWQHDKIKYDKLNDKMVAWHGGMVTLQRLSKIAKSYQSCTKLTIGAKSCRELSKNVKNCQKLSNPLSTILTNFHQFWQLSPTLPNCIYFHAHSTKNTCKESVADYYSNDVEKNEKDLKELVAPKCHHPLSLSLRFCIQYSVFVKVNQNNYKYWEGNCYHRLSSIAVSRRMRPSEERASLK